MLYSGFSNCSQDYLRLKIKEISSVQMYTLSTTVSFHLIYFFLRFLVSKDLKSFFLLKNLGFQAITLMLISLIKFIIFEKKPYLIVLNEEKS